MYIGRVQLICSHPERTQGEGLHFVLFGATGDLAYRKLFPALSVLHKNHDLRIIGIGSSGHTSAEFRQKVLDRTKIDEESFLSSIDYVGLNVSNPSAYAALAEPLLTNPRRRRIVYLSLPPSLFSAAVDGLALAGLIDSNTEVVCEKPFGHSHSDAVSLSTSLLKHLRSDQLHLIDHYLGKPALWYLQEPTASPAFQNLKPFVRAVEVTAFEELDTDGRAAYYDKSGALRDMIQNHLLQLLAEALKPFFQDQANPKLSVLESLTLPKQGDVCFGQYAGYREHPGVPSSSVTETFVSVTSSLIDGVKFSLRTGKLQAEKQTTVLLYFEPSAVAELSLALQAAYDIILSSGRGKASLHTYSGAGPDEAWLQVDLHHATMNWRVRHNGVQRQLSSSLAETREAYLVILADLLNGSGRLLASQAQSLAAWNWVDQLLATSQQLRLYSTSGLFVKQPIKGEQSRPHVLPEELRPLITQQAIARWTK